MGRELPAEWHLPLQSVRNAGEHQIDTALTSAQVLQGPTMQGCMLARSGARVGLEELGC